MTQSAKIFDLTKSFVVVDGRTYPENLHATQREDYPTQSPPVVAYQGYNFLPTGYGYKSYFGINAALDFTALDARVDAIFIFQTASYENILIALCDNGIWTKAGESSRAWEHEITLAVPDEDIRYDWTYCVIEKGLYCYRAQGDVVYFIHPAKDWMGTIPIALVPNLSAIVTPHSGAVSVGTYLYRVAGKFADGHYTNTSDPLTVVVTGSASIIDLHYSADLTAYVGFRIYRTDSNGNTSYFDVGATDSWIDYNQTKIPVVLPDWDALFPAIDTSKFRQFVPNFLNMSGQQGIFRAGQRLGFWDSENSIAWSSIDDFSDFTPSVETLAGSAIFGDVTGRITTIKPHGEGFIIYAKKSIVLVLRKVEATFQWDPTVLFTDNGIAFPEEVCTSSPDTTHFAWTTSGLYKIEKGITEVIVPEIRDFLKDMELPVFMELLEGRYLCLQMLDENYIDGKIALTTSSVPQLVYQFPDGAGMEDVVDPITLTGNSVCYNINTAMMAHATEGATQAGFSGSEAKKQGSKYYKPVYKAYFSEAGAANPDGITWGISPCSVNNLGTAPDPYPMSPIGVDAGKVSHATQDYSYKIDGGTDWDPLTFYAAQIAIWEAGNAKREAFLNAILSRAHVHTVTTSDLGSCAAVPLTEYYCDLGDWIAEVSDPHWGINSCSFWVTRYVIAKMHIQTYSSHRVDCSPTPSIPSTERWQWITGGGVAGNYAATKETAIAAQDATAPTGSHFQRPDPRIADSAYTHYAALIRESDNAIVSGIGIMYVSRWDTCPVGYTLDDYYVTDDHFHVGIKCDPTSLTYTKTETWIARNIGQLQAGAFGVDTGVLVLVGWNVTNPTTGAVTFVARTEGTTCIRSDESTPPTSSPSGGGSKPSYGGLHIAGDTGTLCGIPFEPFTLSGLDFGPISWITESLALPEGSFLLQKGSIGPKYPDIFGAYVYDLHLKKWGKFKQPYKRLLNYSPINSDSGAIIPYSTFGVNAGLIKSNGLIYLFDAFPANAFITYGKIGYYRLGLTAIEEVLANFKSVSTGYITIDGSLDGHTLDVSLSKTVSFTEAVTAVSQLAMVAKWFNITISGIFDLTHLQFRGEASGRR